MAFKKTTRLSRLRHLHSRTFANWLPALAAIYLSLIGFSIHWTAVQPGLDESWMWAINAIQQYGHVFGQDVVFTYGPLGYLMRPKALGTHLGQAALFNIICQLLLGFSIYHLFRSTRNSLGSLLAFLGIAVAYALGLWDEYSHRLVLGLLLLVALGPASSAATIACAAAGILAATLIMVKFSGALSGTAMLLAWGLLLVLKRPQCSLRRAAVLSVAFLTTLAACVLVFFQGPSNFLQWAMHSMEVASGYGTAMSVPGPLWEAVAGVALFAVFAGALFALKGDARAPLILFAIPIVVALKHGFVGFTHFTSGYLTFLVCVAAVCFHFVGSRKELALVSVLFTLSVAVTVLKGHFGLSAPPVTLSRAYRVLSGADGLRGIDSARNWASITKQLQAQAEGMLSEKRLPAAFIKEMKAAPNGADVIPWELSYLPANNIPWRPILVLQHYSAYTRRLDLETAAQLRSPTAPGALLIEYTQLFGRWFFLDTPESFREMLARYEVAGSDLQRSLILLRRRPEPRAVETMLTRLGAGEYHVNQWIEPPSAPGKLYARIDMRPNLSGQIRRYFWKTPSVEIEFEHQSGKRQVMRVIPDTLAGGILINALTSSLRDMVDLFSNVTYDPVKRFRIIGPGLASFDNSIRIEWAGSSGEVKNYSRPSASSAPVVFILNSPLMRKQTELIRITAKDVNGYRDLRHVQVIINKSQTGAGACYISYEAERGIIWLLDDSGNAAVGQGVPGAPEIIENSQCAVNVADVAVRFLNDELQIDIPVALKVANQKQYLYVSASDSSGLVDPWLRAAQWNFDGEVRSQPWEIPQTPPSVTVTASPGERSGSYRLDLRAVDLNGADDLDWVQIIINDVQTGVDACYLNYNHANRTVSLMKDSGSAVAGSTQPGQRNVVANSFCEMTGQGLTIISKPREVVLQIPVRVSSLMRPKRVIYTAALDRHGLHQNWRISGLLPN